MGQVGGGLAGEHVAELAGVGGFVEFNGGRLVGDEQGPAGRAGEGLARVGGGEIVVDHQPVVAVAGGGVDETAIAPLVCLAGAQAAPAAGDFPGVVFAEELDGDGHAAETLGWFKGLRRHGARLKQAAPGRSPPKGMCGATDLDGAPAGFGGMLRDFPPHPCLKS